MSGNLRVIETVRRIALLGVRCVDAATRTPVTTPRAIAASAASAAVPDRRAARASANVSSDWRSREKNSNPAGIRETVTRARRLIARFTVIAGE